MSWPCWAQGWHATHALSSKVPPSCAPSQLRQQQPQGTYLEVKAPPALEHSLVEADREGPRVPKVLHAAEALLARAGLLRGHVASRARAAGRAAPLRGDQRLLAGRARRPPIRIGVLAWGADRASLAGKARQALHAGPRHAPHLVPQTAAAAAAAAVDMAGGALALSHLPGHLTRGAGGAAVEGAEAPHRAGAAPVLLKKEAGLAGLACVEGGDPQEAYGAFVGGGPADHARGKGALAGRGRLHGRWHLHRDGLVHRGLVEHVGVVVVGAPPCVRPRHKEGCGGHRDVHEVDALACAHRIEVGVGGQRDEQGAVVHQRRQRPGLVPQLVRVAVAQQDAPCCPPNTPLFRPSAIYHKGTQHQHEMWRALPRLAMRLVMEFGVLIALVLRAFLEAWEAEAQLKMA